MTFANASWKPRFFTLWIGQAFSLLGSSLVGFALIWWLTTTTGSATVLATASLAGMLPQVLLSPFAGVVVDRFSRRVVMLMADGLTALFTLVLVVLFATNQIQIWHVYIIMAVRSASGAFHFPAMQASTSLMVPDQHLSRVAGMNQTLQGLMSIAAPALGALLVSVLPMHQVMMIDIITAAIAMSTLAFIAIPQPKRAVDQHGQEVAPKSFVHDLRDGVRYVFAWSGLLAIMGMSMVINFLLTPAGSLTPILVTKHFHGLAPQMAMMDAAFGIGMIAGGLLLSVWGGFKRRVYTSLLGLLILGSAFAVQGLLPSSLFPAALVCSLFAGISMPICNGPIFAVLQSSVKPDMQGRVMSLMGTASMAISPLSLMVAGPVADAFGVQVWLVVGGVVCVLMGVAGYFIRPLKTLEDRKVQMAQAEANIVPAAVVVPSAISSEV